MEGELLFVMRDPDNRYTIDQITNIIVAAEQQGHPVEKGSYLESMTIRQLDALLKGRTDA